MQDHHLQLLEYLAFVHTSFGFWILVLHKKKRKPALPKKSENLKLLLKPDDNINFIKIIIIYNLFFV